MPVESTNFIGQCDSGGKFTITASTTSTISTTSTNTTTSAPPPPTWCHVSVGDSDDPSKEKAVVEEDVVAPEGSPHRTSHRLDYAGNCDGRSLKK